MILWDTVFILIKQTYYHFPLMIPNDLGVSDQVKQRMRMAVAKVSCPGTLFRQLVLCYVRLRLFQRQQDINAIISDFQITFYF